MVPLQDDSHFMALRTKEGKTVEMQPLQAEQVRNKILYMTVQLQTAITACLSLTFVL